MKRRKNESLVYADRGHDTPDLASTMKADELSRMVERIASTLKELDAQLVSLSDFIRDGRQDTKQSARLLDAAFGVRHATRRLRGEGN